MDNTTIENRWKKQLNYLNQNGRHHNGCLAQHKAKRQLVWLHANLRADVIHKMTTYFAQKANIIALEMLNIIGMLKNHKLARAIAAAAQHSTPINPLENPGTIERHNLHDWYDLIYNSYIMPFCYKQRDVARNPLSL